MVDVCSGKLQQVHNMYMHKTHALLTDAGRCTTSWGILGPRDSIVHVIRELAEILSKLLIGHLEISRHFHQPIDI
jgi:hypothetical protein